MNINLSDLRGLLQFILVDSIRYANRIIHIGLLSLLCTIGMLVSTMVKAQNQPTEEFCQALPKISIEPQNNIPASFPHAACGTPITEPLTIPVYKTYNNHDKDQPTIAIPVSFGQSSKTSNLLLDTGSSSVVIRCEKIFPANMCSSSGITLQGNMDNINGVTVTNIQAIGAYGSGQYHGNLAFAPVTFYTGTGTVTTGQMPIMIAYQTTDNNSFDGIVGVMMTQGVYLADNRNGQHIPLSSPSLDSPIHYLNFQNGVRPGVGILPLGNADTWPQNVDCLDQQNCPSIANLVFGVNDEFANLFLQKTSLRSLQGENNPYNNQPFPSGLYANGIPACVTLQDGQYCAPTLFDTGTPVVGAIATETKSPQTVDDQLVKLSVLEQTWLFNSGKSPWWLYKVPTSPYANITATQTIGLPFFFNNGYLLDYQQGTLALRIPQNEKQSTP